MAKARAPRRSASRTVAVSADNAQYDEVIQVEGDQVKLTEEEAQAKRRQEIAQKAMERWRIIEEADQRQRLQELEDLQFDRGRKEDHWPADVLDLRKGTADANGRAAAERPSLVVNKLDQPVQQVINEGRQARLALVVKPKPGKANDKDAEVRQGLLRAIEVDSNAHAARMWAYERACKCGRGYYRVERKYANDGDFLIDLVVSRIKNQGTVYIDPFHSEPDARDMEWAFITEDLPKLEYERRFPPEKHRILKLTGEMLTSVTDQARNWITTDTVRIAEHFWVEHEWRWLVQSPDPAAAPILLEAGQEPDKGQRGRRVDKKTVKWCLMNGMETIDEAEWPGRFIPIVQVLGKEYNVAGEVSYKGIITNSKDAQRIYNYAVSAEAEAVGLAPRAPYIAAYGQIEKYRRAWEQANLRNYSYLPYDPVEVNGRLAPPPERNVVEPAIAAIATLVMQADNDIKATTGRWDPSLGNMNPQERSGKAIREMKMQAELGSSNYIEQLATAIRYEGEILLDLIPKTYVEPGRIARLLGDEPGDERSVILNQPFVKGQGGQPQPAPQGADLMLRRQFAQQQGQPDPAEAIEHYDLRRGEFAVVVDVGPSYRTQREENIDLVRGMIESDPNLAPVVGDIMAEEIGGPMGRKLADRMRAMNPNIPQGEDDQLPPAAQALIQQMQQQMQEMQQAMDAQQQALDTDQAKQMAALEIARMELTVKERIEKLKVDAEIASTRAKLQSDEERDRFDAAMKLALENDRQAHELQMKRIEQRFQLLMGERRAQQAAHQAAQGDARKGILARSQADRSERAADRADRRRAALTQDRSS